ncbi:hypothetical protein I5907_06420 [Panacibacter sp. DH6]|uniref:Uncharacterized protein n=1 Tax=Panacibacter microcysteis TaxID=2793269 RepID=A0A931DZK5_9BACT|nr:hypothetical protein [Panacibacter microcysteis]MBG9375862.1 hypothetical protein [Panacibacter microcysteis]
MKHQDADLTKNNEEKPVRENKPNSIGDGLKPGEKTGYPFPGKEDKQHDSQPEFIEPANNNSVNE